MKKKLLKYPVVICHVCGMKYGNKQPYIATWYDGKCGVCGKYTAVTEPRDFGHLKGEWK